MARSSRSGLSCARSAVPSATAVYREITPTVCRDDIPTRPLGPPPEVAAELAHSTRPRLTTALRGRAGSCRITTARGNAITLTHTYQARRRCGGSLAHRDTHVARSQRVGPPRAQTGPAWAPYRVVGTFAFSSSSQFWMRLRCVPADASMSLSRCPKLISLQRSQPDVALVLKDAEVEGTIVGRDGEIRSGRVWCQG